jgi:hypothetical protein
MTSPPQNPSIGYMPLLSAIVSVLIGNFLIGLIFKPAVDHLREIREKLLSVVVPLDEVNYRSFRLAKPWNAEEFEKADEASRHEINEILRKYTLAYHSFKRIGTVFLVALLVLVNFTTVTAVLSVLGAWETLFLCVLVTGTILALARWLATDAYPSPGQLLNLDYLVSHFSNIHPESLIRLLNIGVTRGREENRSQLFLSCAVHLTGYKFFLLMTNKDESRIYVVSYGKVDGRTKVNYVIDPRFYRWNIPLGDINPQWPNGLDLPVSLHLFVFLPTPIGWSDSSAHPYFVSHELWAPFPGGPDGGAGETLGMTICNSRSRDRLVNFQRKKNRLYESWELTSIGTDEDKTHFRLRRLLRFYRHELENATNMCTLTGSRLPPSFSKD